MNSRRDFLASAAAATTLGLHSRSINPADPPVRTQPSRMKLSLAAYSFNSMFARRGTPEQIAAAEMSLEKFINFCAEQNLGAAELTGYYFPKEVTNEYLVSLKQLTHRLGIDISGTAIGNDFCLAEGEARDAQLKMCRDWIDHAAVMGAPVIRIFAGKVPKGDTEAVAIDRCVAGINECLKYAATKGVFLALENHGGITATPEQMLKIIEKVDDSPWFGVNFDSGNFRSGDPYGDLAKIAPYAVNAQVKVAIWPENRKEPTHLARVIKILDDAKYRGYVTLEFEEKKPFEEIPKYLDQLRGLVD